jgi:adenylate cyclase
VDKLRIQLRVGGPLIKRHTQNLEACNLCLKGRYQALKMTNEGLSKSKDYFEQAVTLDPNYAFAWSERAYFYGSMALIGRTSHKEAYANSRQFLMKALSIDEELPDAHALLALYLATTFSWKEAGREFSRALALAPESIETLRNYAHYYLLPMRRLDEAITVMKEALKLDPLYPVLQTQLGMAYYYIREWDRALAQCQSVLEVDPQYWLAYSILGLPYIQLGKQEDAIRAIETAAQLAGRNLYTLGYLGWAYGRSGGINKARQLLKELEELAERKYVPASAIGRIYLGLGKIDRALEWFEKAIEECDSTMINFHLAPLYDELRSHPDYNALLRKMNLES